MVFFSRKVAVTFIDTSTDQVFASMSATPDQLPESFLLHTTLHLDGGDWSVDSAEPPTRPEYTRTGKLVLRVRRVEQRLVSPGDLLFSLPTINDELPAEDELADGTEIILLEDDWRQIEFVDRNHRSQICAEFEDIERVFTDHRKGIGFAACHVRKRIADPLPPTIAAPNIANTAPQRLRFHQHGQRVQGGFAVPLSGNWCLYGSRDGSQVRVLGLRAGNGPLSQAELDTLVQFAAANSLLLVDWCGRLAAEGPFEFAHVLAAT